MFYKMLFFGVCFLFLNTALATIIDRPLFGEKPTIAIKPQNETLPPTKQVLIKAHIVNIDRNYTQSLGLSFNTITNTLSSPSGYTLNLPILANTATGISIPIAELGQGILLEATLSALEQEGHAESISDPQLLTLDNQPALLESGEEMPYQQTSEGGGTTISFKKAVLRLKVTPHIQLPNHILLDLVINQDRVSSLTVNGVPAIKTQQLQTQVLMKNQSTLVLGGIFEENTSEDHQRIPYLSKIPILGYLFSHRQKNNDRRQLLIFVTPIIANV
jgi:type IV pilus assembly protein PilQ